MTHDAIEALARALSRIRSAHTTDELGHECSPDTPCRWCVLQAEQATAAIAALDGWTLVRTTTPTSEREAEIRALIDAAETYSPTEWPQHWIDYRDLLALLDAERASYQTTLDPAPERDADDHPRRRTRVAGGGVG